MTEWREKNRTHSFYEWKTNLMMQNEHTWLTDINWFGFSFVCMCAYACQSKRAFYDDTIHRRVSVH